MKMYTFVQKQFEIDEPVTLNNIYDNTIKEIYDEKIHTHGLESFKHSIRGVINKMTKEEKIKRIGAGLYQKV